MLVNTVKIPHTAVGTLETHSDGAFPPTIHDGPNLYEGVDSFPGVPLTLFRRVYVPEKMRCLPYRSKEEGSMAKTLYVGNLNFRTEEEGLRAAFSEFGNVTDTRIVMDRDTGRSRGFGFVEMEDDEAAETAIERMNGSELDGRPLRVNEAQPRGEGGGGRRGGGGGGRGGYGGGRGGHGGGGRDGYGAY